MATTDAIVNVKVVGIAALNSLETSVQRLQKRFGGLQTALAGLGIAAFARNLILAADDMTDLSNATGIAISKILELQFALEAAGGRFDQMNPIIHRFSISLGEAYDGSLKAQRAFQKVGVSIDDLRTLSDEAIFDKTIRGLAQIENKSLRNAIATEIYGKAIKGLDLDNLDSSLQSLRGTQDQYASSVKRAAELQGNLEVAILRIRAVVLEAIEPYIKFATALTDTAESTEQLANAIEILINVLLILAGGAVGRALFALFGTLARGAKGAKFLFDRLFKTKEAAQQVGDQFRATSHTMNAFRAGTMLVGSGLAVTAGSIDDVDEATKDYNNTLDQNTQKLPTAAQVTDAYAASIQGLQLALQHGKITLEQFQQEVVKADEARKAMLAKISAGTEQKPVDTSELDKQLAAIEEITQAYIDQSNQQLLQISRTIQQITLTDEQKAAQDAFNTSIDNATKAIEQLESKKKDLRKEDTEQLAAINAQQKAIRDRMVVDAEAAGSAARNSADQTKYYNDLAEDIKLLNQIQSDESSLVQLQKQAQLIGLTSDELAKKTIQLQVETDLENKLLDIQKRRNELALKAAQFGPEAVAKEIERLQQEEDAYRRFAERKLEIEQDLHDKTVAIRNDTALASKQFFEDLARSIDPAVLTAQRYESAFANIENAINDLVTTGKFNFKDFALSIIADLLKIQMRAIVVQAILAAIGAIFGGVKPTAAVSSSVSPIPGVGFAAKGANTLAGQPFIVGEEGPELFVPKTAGSIVPNDKMGGQVNAPVTNIVNNYNISAVDAKSVAQLFAENRKSLLGAVGMAQKEMPYMMG